MQTHSASVSESIPNISEQYPYISTKPSGAGSFMKFTICRKKEKQQLRKRNYI
jgi:hypothetical protein